MNVAPHTRSCVECGASFEVTSAELQRLAQLEAEKGGDWQPPRRCQDCRQEGRIQKYEVVRDDGVSEVLRCASCGESFFFGSIDKSYFAIRRWTRPLNCKECRAMRRRHHDGRAHVEAAVAR